VLVDVEWLMLVDVDLREQLEVLQKLSEGGESQWGFEVLQASLEEHLKLKRRLRIVHCSYLI